MATKVDPFVMPIPRSLLNDPESRAYFEYLNRWAHDIWIRTGGGTDTISAVASASNRKADTLLYAVLDKVSLGDDLTTDTTSFTTDNTNFTTDMTES
tara:strand:- start:898 stop:1188 length:291 start_codon:yes stop_codon:yes gene_type:complete